MTPRPLVLLLAAAFSCATPGSGPHEMSGAKHEGAAQQLDTAASAEAQLYEPSAQVTRQRCTPAVGATRGAELLSTACWTSVSNPTDDHRRKAEQLRRQAADHRAGAAALRDAEARNCVGLQPDDRDISPFEHTEDIAGAAALRGPATGNAKVPSDRLVGAIITFRAVPGLTAEWLQRVVDCHLARNASRGHLVPEMPDCPLVPNGATATVTSTGNGFAVSIRANDALAAEEILRRAERLAAQARAAAGSER